MKKWWRSSFFKVIVILIALCLASYASYSLTKYVEIETAERQAYCYDNEGNDLGRCDYQNLDTTDLNFNLYSAYQNLMNYYFRYNSMEDAQNGLYIDQEILESAHQKFINNNEMNDEYARYQELKTLLADPEKYGLDETEIEMMHKEYEMIDAHYNEVIVPLVNAYKETLIRETINFVEEMRLYYENEVKDNYKWRIYTIDGQLITNMDDEENIEDYELFDTYNLGYSMPQIGTYAVNDTPSEVSEVLIAMSHDYYRYHSNQIHYYFGLGTENIEIAKESLTSCIISCVAYVIALIYLVVMAGRRANDDELHLLGIDHVYSDIYLILFIASWCLGFYLARIGYDYLNDGITINNFKIYYLVIANVLAIITMMWATTTSKHLKKRDYFKYSFIGRVLGGIYNIITYSSVKFVNLDDNFKHKVTRILALGIIMNFLLFILIILGLELYLNSDLLKAPILLTMLIIGLVDYLFIRWIIFKYAAQLEIIHEGTTIIADGDLNYQIPSLDDPTLNSMAEDINSISDGLKNSVSEQLASEKTKIELITNVSHDLKTPLTSIISYVDLLGKTNDEEEKKHYLEILGLKSQQLKKLVEDLFEITKIQNGQIGVELQELSMDALVEQVLAEYEEALANKHLLLRYMPLEEKVMVEADGNKTYRVISNIVGNLVKYSMEGTRVYIETTRDEHELHLEFKNIANYEMNFDVSEMSQRFKRGDDSRTSEGNGLGLAIADSFMNIQGGHLDISKDGDLFKVMVSLPIAK